MYLCYSFVFLRVYERVLQSNDSWFFNCICVLHVHAYILLELNFDVFLFRLFLNDIYRHLIDRVHIAQYIRSFLLFKLLSIIYWKTWYFHIFSTEMNSKEKKVSIEWQMSTYFITYVMLNTKSYVFQEFAIQWSITSLFLELFSSFVHKYIETSISVRFLSVKSMFNKIVVRFWSVEIFEIEVNNLQ